MSNAPLWSGLGLVTALDARVSGTPPLDGITGISIDTRSVKGGELFVAIRGDVHDGHDFVRAAFDAGAAAAVVDEAHAPELAGLPCLYVVDDALRALERLGAAARARSAARIVAVTGSVGKTTVKEALRLVMSDAGPTHASAASFNNHWGVPLTLARLPADARYGVFEIGMNHAGEITPLVAMVRPQIAVVTTVAAAHLEHFASVDAIADAKAEIFSGLAPGGLAVINRDIDTYGRLRAAADASPAAHVLTFGEHPEADARLERFAPTRDGCEVGARVLGRRIDFRLGAPGRHLAVNALAVLLAARGAGIDPEGAADSLGRFTVGQGRGARTALRLPEGDATLIDESYNANPTSMRAALEVLATTAPSGTGRRVAVIGDMLELGGDADRLHAELLPDLEAAGVDLVFAAGPLSHALFSRLPAGMRGLWGDTAKAIEGALADGIRAGDVVMVKGSNGSRMGPLVAGLKDRFRSTPAVR
ncbi:UDP-N-acetylmuramoylalanyl-D-glutamyl-2,6-diaminopimelate--D-alanyl-D-alanine ligase [Lichenibacterium minor]|uniref:UDP-N-acetylmuramoyl-tripeptide--D-alanyl-D-alanine ligase n=1 Tax=Lichenibacterium minor TaxID=2316528 RepID=A0A4Q2U5F4_9HYPH|nr:UDP-N-acetylmuramoylalanyl-D-glutamyl-2,6-diaminopimelate--D-alanyl-D-alanine ligase [Lichenibacterium minor]RYC30045.1 UDP-N-acetylmuramoylalanyl-D-glutamyl-2,6-diaminopimelate--D-alanyl-D-alanine ligase [Lichenibacterium minor]